MLTPMLLAIVVFSAASFGTLFNPARDAIIPELVHESKLLKINALIQSTGYLAYFVGLFGAGMLLSAMGLVNLFFLDAGTFLISFFLIMLISYQRKSTSYRTQKRSEVCDLRGPTTFLDHSNYSFK
jgi:MFS family permease